MRSAGLLIITDRDKAVLLCAKRSYDSNKQYTDSARLDKANFLEKISIPRGKHDGRDIFDYETAVREFIEETATFFESAYVYKTPFILQWNDSGTMYKYVIYVGILKGVLKNVSREPNTFCVKLNSSHRPNDYSIIIEPRRFNNEIPRYLYIVPLEDYFSYMSERQLTTYDFSNYLEFFDFVKQIKRKYQEGNLQQFFLLSLQLESLKWKSVERRQQKLELATRQLKNIINNV